MLLLNLKKSTNENQFIKILLESEGDLLLEISEDTVKQEIFLTSIRNRSMIRIFLLLIEQ